MPELFMQTPGLYEALEQSGPKVRLVKYLPEQAIENWPLIKFALAQSWPGYLPFDEVVMTRLLHALAAELLQAWALVKIGGGKVTLQAIGTTAVTRDAVSGLSFLTIYSLYAFEKVSLKSWKRALKAMRNYAIGEGCVSIVANTGSERVAKLALLAGEASRDIVLTMEVRPNGRA